MVRKGLLSLLCALALSVSAQAKKTLEFYFIDVEGGQATLIVSPSGQSLLVDAGWPGYNNRDADRIARAAKAAGVKKIDFLLITHYHVDHVGGVQQLIAKIPVGTFVDHGPNNETGKEARELNDSYGRAVQTGQHLVVKAGDKIPLKGVDVEVVTADGTATTKSLPGGGSNSLCPGTKKWPADPSENARSVGFVLTYGKFRFVDYGDLTGQKELDLACPDNRIGPVSLYLTTHHGFDQSNAEPLVHAMKPRVAVMNNGARKGGSPEAWKVVKSSPGLEDMWQLHYSIAGGKDNNVNESFIANLEERNCEGKGIRVEANSDGSFEVSNERNKYAKTYPAH
jgi:competence protein ComEC